MRITVLTIFPELFEPFLDVSLVGRARRRGLMTIEIRQLRDFTDDPHRVVDDEPYGGGAGMVMKAEPWLRAVRAQRGGAETGEGAAGSRPRRVLLSPRGGRLDETGVRRLAGYPWLVLLCGRYEGIDERVGAEVDEAVSIGDYVLSGGELPAMVLIEALSRQIPGVVGDPDSVRKDSFRRGLLDHPHYTRPRSVDGEEVPEVLLSGDHAAIERWRRDRALLDTLRRRPDLLAAADLEPGERDRLLQVAAEEGLEDFLPETWRHGRIRR